MAQIHVEPAGINDYFDSNFSALTQSLHAVAEEGDVVVWLTADRDGDPALFVEENGIQTESIWCTQQDLAETYIDLLVDYRMDSVSVRPILWAKFAQFVEELTGCNADSLDSVDDIFDDVCDIVKAYGIEIDY